MIGLGATYADGTPVPTGQPVVPGTGNPTMVIAFGVIALFALWVLSK
jgi:hypothetical protein